MLLMLEDNAERVQRFTAALQQVDPALELRVWRDAWKMIREVERLLPLARVISLDHDLDPEEGAAADPGTGWDLTRALAAFPPCCPVIIHTSNGERADWMMGEFELGGWEHHRVAPLGDDWIERDWRRLIRRLLRRNRASKGERGRELRIPAATLTPTHAGFACRLRPRQLRRGSSPIVGEVELENMSSTVLELEVRTSPLQYLNLVVTDAAGNVVSETHYGDLFSPLPEPYTLKLQPGEKLTGPVSLLGNVPQEKWQPGEYTVRAVFEYNGLRAVSDPLQVRLPAKGS